MNRVRCLRLVVGLMVSLALLAAPVTGHAGNTNVEEGGILAALSVTCLDPDGISGDGGGFDHGASACHVCPAGSFGACALPCGNADAAFLSWQRIGHEHGQKQAVFPVPPDDNRARSPPSV